MADAVRGNALPPAQPLQQLADPGEIFRVPQHVEWLRTFLKALRDVLGRAVLRDQASPFLHLISPGGKTYKVTVADDGSIQAELIRG